MADITAALITKLKATSSITAVVGSGDAARCWPDKWKEITGRFPCIVIRRQSGGQDVTLLGPSGIESAAMEVESWAISRAAADSLDVTIRTALTATAKPQWDSVYLAECTAGPAAIDTQESPPNEGSDGSIYLTRTTYNVVYNAT